MINSADVKQAAAAEVQELRKSAPTTELEASPRTADHEIARSEAKFRRLFETAHDGILILNAESGEITNANPFVTMLLGYSEEEMLGKKLWELGPFRDVATSRAAFTELQAQESIRYEDLPLETRSGRMVEVEFVSNVYEANGEKVIQCNIRDVSERKRMAEATYQSARITALRAAVGLSLSETRDFPKALESCAEAFVMHFSIALAQLWIYNPAGEGLSLGANAGIAAQPDLRLDGDPPGYSMIRRIVETGEPLTSNSVALDARLSNREWFAREHIVAFAGYPLTVDGRVVGVLGLYAEQELSDAALATINSLPNHLALTIDRQQRLRELEVADERLRFAMQSAYVGVWDLDCATQRLQWSPIMEEQHGVVPGTFAGTLDAFRDLIHPEDRDAALKTMNGASHVGGDFSIHYRTAHADDTVRWLRGEGRYVLDAEGTPIRASGVSLDITEQLAQQAQSQQAQKMEAIGRLAGGVAHDFNNLLTVILSLSELVLGTLASDDPNRSDMREIQKAGMRAASLTRQLLTFSRRSVIEPRVLDVNETVTGLLPMLTRLISDDVKIVTRLNADSARVIADAGQMEQVLVNLVVNARDAMPKGGTLLIETGSVELDEEYVATNVGAKPGAFTVLTVTDEGAGISEEVLKHIFEPFFTTKAMGKGTGLGLATVHGIVLQSGGSIGVYSEVGHGTSFKVYLPLVTTNGEPVSAPPVTALARGGTETILVVEDSAPLRSVTKRMLEEAGYTVIVASNSAEAQARFQLSPTISLVLTDVMMPGGNGPDLATKLLLVRSDTRIVFMSGYSEDAISHHGVLDTGISFLPKPFTAGALRRKVRERLDDNAGQDEA